MDYWDVVKVLTEFGILSLIAGVFVWEKIRAVRAKEVEEQHQRATAITEHELALHKRQLMIQRLIDPPTPRDRLKELGDGADTYFSTAEVGQRVLLLEAKFDQYLSHRVSLDDIVDQRIVELTQHVADLAAQVAALTRSVELVSNLAEQVAALTRSVDATGILLAGLHSGVVAPVTAAIKAVPEKHDASGLATSKSP